MLAKIADRAFLHPMLPASLSADLIRWRRDFHRHPELGFCEFRTAATVAATLEKLGWHVAAGAQYRKEGFPREQ